MKLFGVVLLTLAGALLGIYGELLAQRRLLFYRQLHNLFRCLAEDVSFFQLSYLQLFLRYQKRPNLPSFLSRLTKALEAGQALSDASQAAIAAACSEQMAPEEICSFLCGIFAQLGGGSLQQEIRLLQGAERHMGRILENEEAGYAKCRMLAVKVCAVIGMALGILMM